MARRFERTGALRFAKVMVPGGRVERRLQEEWREVGHDWSSWRYVPEVEISDNEDFSGKMPLEMSGPIRRAVSIAETARTEAHKILGLARYDCGDGSHSALCEQVTARLEMLLERAIEGEREKAGVFLREKVSDMVIAGAWMKE